MPWHEFPICCTHVTCKRVIERCVIKARREARLEAVEQIELVLDNVEGLSAEGLMIVMRDALEVVRASPGADLK